MAQNSKEIELLKLIADVSSGVGRDAVINHSLSPMQVGLFKEQLAGALGIPKSYIKNVNSATGIVKINDGVHEYEINLVGKVKGSPTYANYKGKQIVNRVVMTRGDDKNLGLTDLVDATRRAAIDIIKNDHRIKEASDLKQKIHYINQEITSLQKDYLQIEDSWDIKTSKAERRSRPSSNIVTDTERASTVNYQHQLEKDMRNLGAYWKEYVVRHKKNSEDWETFNERVGGGAEGIAQDIVSEILSGTDKKVVVQKYPEFRPLINQLYKDYGFLGGTASAANRKRSVLLPINEVVSHNIGTAKEHQTGNVATLWNSGNKAPNRMFKNITGVSTKRAATVAHKNSIKLGSGNVYLAKVVTDKDIAKEGGVLNSIHDSHMMLAQQAAEEMKYIARDFKKQISIKEIQEKNKNFKNWKDPNALKKAIRNVLESDKDFLEEMKDMTEEEMNKFYEGMEINGQGFNENSIVSYEIKNTYKKDHFKQGSGKMVNVGGTGRSTALVSGKDNFGTVDGIPVTILVGEALKGAKTTSDIIMDQMYKLVQFGTSNGERLSEMSEAKLAEILNKEIRDNPYFEPLRAMGFEFEIQDGRLIYNFSTGDIEKGAEALYEKKLKSKTGQDAKNYAKKRAEHIEEFKNDINKQFFEFLSHFNKNLSVVTDTKVDPKTGKNLWHVTDKLAEYQFTHYSPADVGAPNKGNTSSGGFEGQRNVVENAKKFGKEFQAGIKAQYMSKGEELARRRESWKNTQKTIQTNQKLVAGTHGTKIELNDILPKDFDPDKEPDLDNEKYIGNKMLASAFDQTIMGSIIAKVASGELDLSHGGFIDVPWIDEKGNERRGIPIEPITKAEAQKLQKEVMYDTEGNKFEVYNSEDIDPRFSLFNKAFSFKTLYNANANNATPEEREKVGDKMLRYGHIRSKSLTSNDGPEAERYGKSDTFNSIRGVAHAANSAVKGYTSNTIWLSDESLQRMFSRREDKNAKYGLSDDEANAILNTWNQLHKGSELYLDYQAWQEKRAEDQDKTVQRFLYETIKENADDERYADLAVAGVNRDPTIGLDATKWARVRYNKELVGNQIGVSDDLAWLVSGDFDGDQIRAALLALGMGESTAEEITKRYEQARTAQQDQTKWGDAINRWFNYLEEHSDEDESGRKKSAEEIRKEFENIYTSEDARLANNEVLKDLNAEYTSYAKTKIGNFGNNQFNAMKLLSSDNTNLIGSNPAETELFLSMMEQYYQEAISGKKLLEQALESDDPDKVFKEGKKNLDALAQLISDPNSYKTAEGRLKLIETFQDLLGISHESENFFVNKKLKTQSLVRVASTQEGRKALYDSLDKDKREKFNKIGFLKKDFDIKDLTGEQLNDLYESSFFSKTNTLKAFETVVNTLDSQGKLEDLIYNKTLDTNYQAQVSYENIEPMFQSLEGSNQKLIDALNRLSNILEGKAGGAGGGFGGKADFSAYNNAEKLKFADENDYSVSVSTITGAIKPYGGQDTAQLLRNLTTKSNEPFFGYGSAAKLKKAAGGKPFATLLGNASGSMGELLAMMHVSSWKDIDPSKLEGDALMLYNDVLENQKTLQEYADAYYGEKGIKQKNYSFKDYFKKNVIDVAEKQVNQLEEYFKQTGIELTGEVFPEAMVAGLLGDTKYTSRTDIGYKGKYQTTDATGKTIMRNGLIFTDLKNKESGPLGVQDAMQAILTNQAMRTTLQKIKQGDDEGAQSIVDRYNQQMHKLGYDTNYTLDYFKDMFKGDEEDGYMREADLKNLIIKGSTIYELNANRSAQTDALELILSKYASGETLSKEEEQYIISMFSSSTDTGTIAGMPEAGSKKKKKASKTKSNSNSVPKPIKQNLSEFEKALNTQVRLQKELWQLEGQYHNSTGLQKELIGEKLDLTQNYLAEASNAVGDIYNNLDDVNKEKVAGSIEKSRRELDLFNAQLDITQGKHGKGLLGQFADGLKLSMQRMFSFGMMGMKVAGMIGQSFRKIMGYAQQLDQVMVNIQIVAGKTREEAFTLMQTYNNLAKSMGSTTTEVANSANVWFNESRDHIKPL